MPPSRTRPSLAPDARRRPKGTPERPPRSLMREDIGDVELQNAAAVVLARAGYDTEYRHNKPITAAEVKRNPRLQEGRQPDYIIEGQVFDCVAPRATTSARNIATRIAEEKIAAGQATRFILNLDRSRITLEDLRDQLAQYSIDGLDEIIIVRGDNIVSLFPFDD